MALSGFAASGKSCHVDRPAGGRIGVIAWMLQLGNVMSFVSETILSGFKVGVGLVIASTQVPKLLGMSSSGNEFFDAIAGLARHWGEINLPSLAVGVVTLALILLGERFLSGRPVALAVLDFPVVVMFCFLRSGGATADIASDSPAWPPSVT
jgi:MFS superfamily sulfate permease-like transporter